MYNVHNSYVPTSLGVILGKCMYACANTQQMRRMCMVLKLKTNIQYPILKRKEKNMKSHTNAIGRMSDTYRNGKIKKTVEIIKIYRI